LTEFIEIQKKGVKKTLIESTLDPERLSLHISEIAAGTRAHPPHIHAGVEGFYVLEGAGAVETEGRRVPVAAGEIVILDPSKLHGLANTGDKPMKYIVIITKP
jgi:quercetin dioxygenase-like cupin family protein